MVIVSNAILLIMKRFPISGQSCSKGKDNKSCTTFIYPQDGMCIKAKFEILKK